MTDNNDIQPYGRPRDVSVLIATLCVAVSAAVAEVAGNPGESASARSAGIRYTSPWSRAIPPVDEYPVLIHRRRLSKPGGPKQQGTARDAAAGVDLSGVDTERNEPRDPATVHPSPDEIRLKRMKTPFDISLVVPPGKTIAGQKRTMLREVPLPSPGTRMACELRIVDMADRRVIRQVSGITTFEERRLFAEHLIAELLDGIDGDAVALVSLCNRRKTKVGLKVSSEWTDIIVGVLERNDRFRSVELVDLRERVNNEYDLENTKVMTGSRYRSRMNGAAYVILGGVAMSRVHSVLHRNETVRSED